MRDIYKVLREKEDAIAQVRREVQALRSLTPLLADAVRREAHERGGQRTGFAQQLRFLLMR
jgi:hypothetical protein